MAHRPSIAAVCLVTLLSPAAGRAAADTPDKLGGLLANSPFGIPRAGTVASAAAEPLEFRAVLEENGNRIFSIHDNSTHQSTWVDLNDPVKDFSVKEFDAASNSVMVEYQGRPLKLALKRAPAVVAPLPIAIPGAPVPAAGRNMQVAQAQGAPTPVPAQQLQQIRDEINRRRALRAQPVVPANTAGSPATVTTPPPAPSRP